MPICKAKNVSLYYEMSGSGTPILWVQGVGVVGNCWRPQVTAMSEFASLIFDNRGVGRSVPCEGAISVEAMAEDAAAVMKEVGWSSAHIVGHSMGGLIAQELALREPAKVRSLSLVCTFSQGPEAARLTPWVLWMSLRTRLGSKPMRRRAFLEMILSPEYLRANDTEKLAADLAPLMGRDLAEQPAILMKQVMAMSRYNRSEELRRLGSIPTLVISAAKDPIAKPAYGKRLASLIPGAQYHEIPAASHAVTIELAAEITASLRRFFQRAG